MRWRIYLKLQRIFSCLLREINLMIEHLFNHMLHASIIRLNTSNSPLLCLILKKSLNLYAIRNKSIGDFHHLKQ